MSNSIAPGSSADVNVRVTALTTNSNVPAQYKTIIFKKNLVNGVNTLTQAMMNQTNTKYVIKYDYVLGDDISVPANCVLEFDGGSISGSHTITGVNTEILSGLVKIFDTNVTFEGSWNIAKSYPEWFGGSSDTNNDVSEIVIKALVFHNVYFTSGTYIINHTVPLTNYNHSIIINPNASLYKTANPSEPMFHFRGSGNKIVGDGGQAVIRSTVVTPNGIIALGDVDNMEYTRSDVMWAKLNNLSISGTPSTEEGVQSVDIYCKSTYSTPVVYYASFTNLLIRTCNIGIKLHGDTNAFFIRDVVFYEVGARSASASIDAGTHETDCAILLESLDDAYVYGNIISQIWHTNSDNAVTVYFKNKVYHNNIFGVKSEIGAGSGAYGTLLKQRGEGAYGNELSNFTNNNQLGFLLEDYFYSRNYVYGNGSVHTRQLNALDTDNIHRIDPNGSVINNKCFFKYVESETVYDGEYLSLIKIQPQGSASIIVNFNIACVAVSNNYNIPSIKGTLIVKRRGNDITWKLDNVINYSGTLIKPYNDGGLINLVLRNDYQGSPGNYGTKFCGYFEIITNNSAQIIGTNIKLFDEKYVYNTQGFESYNLRGWGSTASRPSTSNLTIGYMYFDNSSGINKPIWWNGSAWVDATGATV